MRWGIANLFIAPNRVDHLVDRDVLAASCRRMAPAFIFHRTVVVQGEKFGEKLGWVEVFVPDA